MLKLIKYEFIRKYKFITMILVTAIALNLLMMTRGPQGTALFLLLSPIVLYAIYLIDVIKMYSDDLNKKTAYMIFMTPNSGYKIILSKLLTAILEGFGLLVIYLIFILVNGVFIVLSTGSEVSYNQLLSVVNNLLSGSFGFNLLHILIFLLAALIFILAFITTVYTAITIRKSIFSEVKLGGLFSFIIFLCINWVISSISSYFYDFLDNGSVTMSSAGAITPRDFAILLLPTILISIVQITILTGFSGYLLEEKINL